VNTKQRRVMRKPFVLLSGCLLVAALFTSLNAQPAGGVKLTATLSGAAEVPGPGDPDGTGSAIIILNPGLEQVQFHLEVFNIAPAFAAHIHRGTADVAGPVVVPLSPPTSGSSSGTVNASRELILEILRNPAGFYVNVHNAEFPAGAVRGQLNR
jgi:hypothetical protein